MMRTPRKYWTSAEIGRAVKLWDDGATYSEIAERLGRTREAGKSAITERRERFAPRVAGPVGKREDGGINKIKLSVSPELFAALQAAAKARHCSVAIIMRETLAERFLAGTK